MEAVFMKDIHRSARSSGRVAAATCALLLAGSISYSQQPPAAPLPHSRPDLPGTHVRPDPVLKSAGVVLHVDGPLVVEQKRCKQDDFEIRYSVVNRSAAPMSGTIRAALNGVELIPVGTAKLSQLQPGKALAGAFLACCPANGLFPLRLEYRAEGPQAEVAGVSITAEPVNISCK